MTIPDNPISPEEEPNDNMIAGEQDFPESNDDFVIPISQETSIVSSEVPQLEDPVGETAELLIIEEDKVVDSTYMDLDEPGEITETVPQTNATKPAYIAILTIIGLLILCCVMAGVMLLLLREPIFAGG